MASALPNNISYGLITGRFLAAVEDTADLDRYPDGAAMVGSVVFTPQLDASAPYLLDPTANPAPVTVFPKPQTATLDDSGYLCGPDGARGIELVATDDNDLVPLHWTYRVEYRLQNVSVAPFDILVPGGVITDLTQVAVVPTSTGLAGVGITTAPSATSANLNNAGNDINTTGKTAGRQVWNTTTTRPVYATGPTPTATWKTADGVTAHTPT